MRGKFQLVVVAAQDYRALRRALQSSHDGALTLSVAECLAVQPFIPEALTASPQAKS